MTKFEMFRAGWRPTLGWVTVIIVVFSFIVHPSLVLYFSIVGVTALPVLDFVTLVSLVSIIIGMGTLRTYEKIKEKKDNDD